MSCQMAYFNILRNIFLSRKTIWKTLFERQWWCFKRRWTQRWHLFGLMFDKLTEQSSSQWCVKMKWFYFFQWFISTLSVRPPIWLFNNLLGRFCNILDKFWRKDFKLSHFKYWIKASWPLLLLVGSRTFYMFVCMCEYIVCSDFVCWKSMQKLRMKLSPLVFWDLQLFEHKNFLYKKKFQMRE